jgi:uncharacterized protein (TIGR04551 family)
MRTSKLPRTLLPALGGAFLTLAGGARAEGPAPGEAVVVPARYDGLDGTDTAVRTAVPLRLEHRGMLRLRPELVAGGHLEGQGSGIPAPIAATTGDDRDASTLGWASLRLRYRPVLHIGSSVRISLGIDAPDNLVLGSTHENAGGILMPPFGLRDAQAPASSGQNGWRDGIRIREAALQVRLFDFIDLDVGRGLDHFGLGLYRNDGGGLDADFGSVIDRIGVGFNLAGFRIEGAFEFTATGATSADAYPWRDGADGQPKDLGMDDDVVTWSLRAGRFARSDAELAERERLLNEGGGWAVDWALFTTLTDQRYSSSAPLADTSVECAPTESMADGRAVQPYDCIRLFRRGAFLFRPGVWVRAESRPTTDSRLRIEVEAQALFGSVDHVQRLLDEDIDDSRAFSGLGAAVELEAQVGRLGFGLDLGLATGDNGQFVGLLDGQNVLDPDDDAFVANDAFRRNRNITSFAFHRDYRVDLILFRQVLGGVTNAAYMKPWVGFELMRTEETALGVRLDAMYAAAMRPSGTPGDGAHWGLEFDGSLALEMAGGFEAQLTAGVFVPLDAFQDALTGALPGPAYALRGIMAWRF